MFLRKPRRSFWMRRLAWVATGLVLQTTSGGCEQVLTNITDALGNPVATGVGNAVSDLVQVLVLSAFV